MRSRTNALSLCHHWFGGADKVAQCWTVTLTRASAPLAAPNHQIKNPWVLLLWPYLKLMRSFSRIFPVFSTLRFFQSSSGRKTTALFTGIQSHPYQLRFSVVLCRLCALPQRGQSDHSCTLHWIAGEKSICSKVNSTWLFWTGRDGIII